MIYEDQLAVVKRDSPRSAPPALARSTWHYSPTLKAEREQGITSNVAYRYFSTDKRKFIIADTPGHDNTPATWHRRFHCQLAIILIDAPARRHAADAPAFIHRFAARHQARCRRDQ